VYKKIGLGMALAWFLVVSINAEPCGAVLYRLGGTKHYSHFNVPDTAYHHYFGYLEGPAWENKFCGYRTYVDSANRNCIDFIVKYQPGAVLQYFNDTAANEHNLNTWGTDCFNAGSSMGLGAFRLFYNNQWVNPKIGKAKTVDSLVITIPDSSTATPKLVLTYYGWNLGGGTKVTVTWTITTTLNERPTHCEVNIAGAYTGKVVVGITNNNKINHPVTIIKDSTRALLASIGLQGGLNETFTDTLLLAAYSSKTYFSSFSDDNLNSGMVLTPDVNHSVKWSIAYSEKRETTPFYRSPNWEDSLVQATAVLGNNRGKIINPSKAVLCQKTAGERDVYSILGRKINARSLTGNGQKIMGLYFERMPDGALQKRIVLDK
jgi:hypothetical protein